MILKIITHIAVLAVGVIAGWMASPKVRNYYQIVDSKTYVTTTQETYQNTMQGQVTAVITDGKQTERLSVNLNGATNIRITRATNGYTVAQTNARTNAWRLY